MAKVVPPGAPAPQSVLGWDGTDFCVLRVDATGHLQVDALTTALPAGAATAAHQITQITALQLIDDLRNALQSVGTDRLQVRGEDQLFSLAGVLSSTRGVVISGANGYVDSTPIPANRYGVITNVMAQDATTATVFHLYRNRHDGADVDFAIQYQAFGIGQSSQWHGHVFLDAGDVVRVYFGNALAGDNCSVNITGYLMTVEV